MAALLHEDGEAQDPTLSQTVLIKCQFVKDRLKASHLVEEGEAALRMVLQLEAGVI